MIREADHKIKKPESILETALVCSEYLLFKLAVKVSVSTLHLLQGVAREA